MGSNGGQCEVPLHEQLAGVMSEFLTARSNEVAARVDFHRKVEKGAGATVIKTASDRLTVMNEEEGRQLFLLRDRVRKAAEALAARERPPVRPDAGCDSGPVRDAQTPPDGESPGTMLFRVLDRAIDKLQDEVQTVSVTGTEDLLEALHVVEHALSDAINAAMDARAHVRGEPLPSDSAHKPMRWHPKVLRAHRKINRQAEAVRDARHRLCELMAKREAMSDSVTRRKESITAGDSEPGMYEKLASEEVALMDLTHEVNEARHEYQTAKFKLRDLRCGKEVRTGDTMEQDEGSECRGTG